MSSPFINEPNEPKPQAAVMHILCDSLEDCFALMLWANKRRLEFSLHTRRNGGYKFLFEPERLITRKNGEEVRAEALKEYSGSNV